MDMINLKINGQEVSVPAGYTILEAAREVGIDIPTLCFLKDLSETGSCRMCVVEVVGARALQAACVYPVSEGMEVLTHSPRVKKARKATLELILSNHDRKCLTCVRNQNCELQKLSDEEAAKIEELKEICENNEIDLIIFDCELSPSQLKNIEDFTDIDTVDRTMLILDIFAQRALTAEGKLQVEIACLRYTAPRLTGKGTELSRLGGGIGTRGPGESKLESDRRHLKRRIAALEEELAEMQRTRDTKRAEERCYCGLHKQR